MPYKLVKMVDFATAQNEKNVKNKTAQNEKL